MVDYYPVLARAISSLPRDDAEARREVYARARTIVTEHLRQRDREEAAPETRREQAALETAIRRVEAEARPVRPRTNDKPGPTQPPANHATGAEARTKRTAKSLARILGVLQSDEPRPNGRDLSDRKTMNGTKALAAHSQSVAQSPAKPPAKPRAQSRAIVPIDKRQKSTTEEMSGVPNAVGTMLFGLAYIVAALAFTFVTYVRCIVWVHEGVIGYPILLIVMAITVALFIATPIAIYRKA